MSHWIWPTTADLGLRAMAPTKSAFLLRRTRSGATMDVTGTPTSRLMHGEWNAVLETRVDAWTMTCSCSLGLTKCCIKPKHKGDGCSVRNSLTRDTEHAGVHAVTYVAADELERGVKSRRSAATASPCRP